MSGLLIQCVVWAVNAPRLAPTQHARQATLCALWATAILVDVVLPQTLWVRYRCAGCTRPLHAGPVHNLLCKAGRAVVPHAAAAQCGFNGSAANAKPTDSCTAAALHPAGSCSSLPRVWWSAASPATAQSRHVAGGPGARGEGWPRVRQLCRELCKGCKSHIIASSFPCCRRGRQSSCMLLPPRACWARCATTCVLAWAHVCC